MKSNNLSDEQSLVLEKVCEGISQRRAVQKVGGYAGTGKTHLISMLAKRYKSTAICAYTGKAASVLRSKELPASTIHSLMYVPHYKTVRGEVVLSHWTKKAINAEVIIVDESSMVSRSIFEDLVSQDIPIVFFGDHGQLGPIDGEFNLMKYPDYTLETIHRNAGPIASVAELARKGMKLKYDGKHVIRAKYSQIEDEKLSSVDQIICAFNKTRIKINERVRKYKKFDSTLEVGDKIMTLENNEKFAVFNGMQGKVIGLVEESDKYLVDIEMPDRNMYAIPISKYGFNHPDIKSLMMRNKKKTKVKQDQKIICDYSYAITCHKSQGDEYGTGIVIHEQCGAWDMNKWSYTAFSRFKKQLIVAEV